MADAPPQVKIDRDPFAAAPASQAEEGWFETKSVDPLQTAGSIVPGAVVGDATTAGTGPTASSLFRPAAPTSFTEAVQQQVISSVASSAWEQATGVSKYIPTIESLRPYYDTHPSVVFKRMVYAVVPLRSSIDEFYATFDLYGPSMIALTLAAVILLGMKFAGTQLYEGTLVGTALSAAFGYWFGGAAILYLVGKLCGAELKAVESLALVGYGLVGYCVTLLVSMLWDGAFWWMLLVVGGLSSARIAMAAYSRATGPRALFFAVFAGLLHFSFLIYIYLRYTRPYPIAAAAAAAATPVVVTPPAEEEGSVSTAAVREGPSRVGDEGKVTLPGSDGAQIM